MTWFHCGRCGSLFKSTGGDLPGRVCTECGCDPSLGLEPEETTETVPATALPALHRSTADLPRHVTRPRSPDRGVGRRKARRLMPLLVLGWLAFIALIVLGGRLIWHEDTAVAEREPVATTELRAVVGASDAAFLEQERPECQRVFGGFLSVATPQAGNQFVAGSTAMVGRMERFFRFNPLIRLDPATLSPMGSTVLDLPQGRAIETRWKSADGRQVEAVFLRERNQWRLDWEHYVRYSDYPWPLFIAGSGEPSGEFRLLARQRQSLSEEEATEETGMSLVFYAPRFGHPREPAAQSPEFTVEWESAAAKLLEAAFRREKEGRRLFGSILPSPDPEGMIRVRVKVRRIEDDAARRFEIEEVIACHWLSIDASGIPDEDKDEDEDLPGQPSAE